MLLRTRLTLMVSAVSLGLIVSLFGVGNWRAQGLQDDMEQARLQAQKSAWIALVQNDLQPLENLARAAARNGAVTAALLAGDRPALMALVKTLQAEAGSQLAGAAIEIADVEGRALLATEAGDAVLGKAIVAAAGRAAGPLSGLYYTAAGVPVLGVTAPLYSRSGLAGAIAVSVDPQPTVGELAAAIGADVLLGDAAGAFPIGSGPRAAAPAALFAVVGGDASSMFIDGGRRKLVTRTLVPPASAGSAAALLTVRDVTDSERRKFWLAVVSFGGIVAGAALALGFLHWYMRRAFRPLYDVMHMLYALARGERSTQPIAIGGDDEIGRLADTAVDFRQGLDARDQLLKLRQDIAAAHNIQTSMLPTDPPPRREFSVKAFMRPARDVGGDFFDFFDLPDGRFAFVIADVSGKGMGAALFMAVACTVIRSTARLVADPGECLARVNDLLAANNAQTMFVTVFYGVYDPASGVLIYANGGHNPPYLVRGDGTVAPLPTTNGALLAVLPGFQYDTAELTLAPGECLYLYTDGVTEAQNDGGALFGDGRLTEALAAAEREPQQMLSSVLERIGHFVADAPQADDITCLVLARQPGGS